MRPNERALRLRRRGICASLISAALIFAACQPVEMPGPVLRVPGMNYRPTLDGLWYGARTPFRREWGWTCAAQIPALRLADGTVAPEKTSLRLFYSSEALYVAGSIDGNFSGSSPATACENGIELRLKLPGGKEQFRVELCPRRPVLAQRLLGKRAAPWPQSVQVGRKLWDSHWQFEMRFPYSAFVGPGEYMGTPSQGTRVGLVVRRYHRDRARVSRWPGAEKGRLVKWGWIQASERPAGVSWLRHPFHRTGVRVLAATLGRPWIGVREASLTVENPSTIAAQVTVSIETGHIATWSMLRHRLVAERKLVLPPKARRRVTLGYPLPEAKGKLRLRLLVTVAGYSGASYLGEVRFTYRGTDRKSQWQRKLMAIARRCRAVIHPLTRRCARESRALLRRLAAALAPNQRMKPLDQTLEKAIARFTLAYHNRLRPRLGQLSRKRLGAPVRAAVLSSMHKVRPDTPIDGPLDQPLRLSLARGEAESVQLVLLATTPNFRRVRVVTSPLHGPAGARIDGAQIQVQRIGTIVTKSIRERADKLWPDPLYPTDRAELRAGVPQPMLITVTARSDQPPGLYHGEVRIVSAGHPALVLPFHVRIYSFGLPVSGSLFNEIWWDNYRAQAFYGPLTPGLLRRFVRATQPFRVVPNVDFGTASTMIGLAVSGKGDLVVDWRRLDPYLRILRDAKRARINISFSPVGVAWLQRLRQLRRSALQKGIKAQTVNQLYVQLLRETSAHLVKLGFARSQLYYAGVDEPSSTTLQRQMRPLYRLAKTALPWIPRTAAAVYGAQPGARSLTEIWCPQVRFFDKRHYAGDRRQRWLYTCWQKFPPYPCYSAPVPGIAARIVGWIARKYGISAFLYWGMNVWTGSASINRVRLLPFQEKPWVHDRWRPPFESGDGLLLYPTPAGPIPSLRLVQIRDSTDDYDYLLLLGRLAQRVTCAPESLRAQARKLSQVPPEMVRSTVRWTLSPDTLLRTRHKIALTIEQLLRHQRSCASKP